MLTPDLEELVERYHLALDSFMKGDIEPARELFSRGDDVTLANPFGPVARGWHDVGEAMARAGLNYRDGEAVGFDRISAFATPDLAYVVEVERLQSKVGGGADIAELALRVTTVFRREDQQWRIAHRHADPITSPRGAESVLP